MRHRARTGARRRSLRRARGGRGRAYRPPPAMKRTNAGWPSSTGVFSNLFRGLCMQRTCRAVPLTILVLFAARGVSRAQIPVLQPPGAPYGSGCVDTDHDGLCDVWEIAGGIDLNGDVKIKEKDDL